MKSGFEILIGDHQRVNIKPKIRMNSPRNSGWIDKKKT